MNSKRLKTPSGMVVAQNDPDSSSSLLRRKSIAPAAMSKKMPPPPETSPVSKNKLVVAKRKSCPAIGAGSLLSSKIADFLTPERIANVLDGGEDIMEDTEKSREIRRIINCLNSLVEKEHTESVSNKVFHEILRTIRENVDSLNDDNCPILYNVLQYAMLPQNCGTFFTAVEDLINEVIIHRPNYASSLIGSFMSKLLRRKNKTSPSSSMELLDESSPSIAELKCFDASIRLINRIVDIIGAKSLNRPLINMMTNSYPYVLRSPLTHYYYVRNLIAFNRQAGNSTSYSVFSVLIHKLAHLDSFLPRDVLESERLEDFILPKLEKSASAASPNSNLIPMEDADEFVDEIIKSYKKIAEEMEQSHQVATLDVVLSYLISYLSDAHENINFNSLLSIFEAEVLPIFNCNCVQFIFFYLINLKEEYLNAFLEFLWKKFLNINTPLVLRILCVGYIAGVLARSTKVDRRTLKRWVSRLSAFAHEYLNSKSDSFYSWANVNTNAHGPFYAVCQAIFYTFAFRHFELVYGNVPCLKEEDGKPQTETDNKSNFRGLQPPSSSSSFLYALNLQRLITCDLNPLKACIPSIAKTFGNIAQVYQISYCKTVLERNRRANIKSIICEDMRDNGETVNLLNDSFFPFDPLLLPYAKSIVEDCYRPYDGNCLALSLVGDSISEAVDKLAKEEKQSQEEDLDDINLEESAVIEDEVDGAGNILLDCE